MTESGADVFPGPPPRTFMFSSKPSFRSRPPGWFLASLSAHCTSRAPNSSVSANGCVTVKLLLCFLLFFFTWSSSGVSAGCCRCARVHHHFAWLKTDLLHSGVVGWLLRKSQLWTSAAPPSQDFRWHLQFGGGFLSCFPGCPSCRYLLPARRRLTIQMRGVKVFAARRLNGLVCT